MMLMRRDVCGASHRRRRGVSQPAGVAGCGGSAEPAAQAPPAMQVGQENVVRVARDTIVAGPIISGQVRAREEATVRAEIGGPVLQVAVEEGQAVRRGALLGAHRRRRAARTRSDRPPRRCARRRISWRWPGGRPNGPSSWSPAARWRRATSIRRAPRSPRPRRSSPMPGRASSAAEKQFGDAVLRAPLAGIVSDRAVNVGDVVSPGTAMFTIIDPSSMRLEASVPSDELSALRVGGRVQFRVRGNDQTFDGTIERISPATDPTTGQVPIFASIPNAAGRLVAGLYAEGRVVTESVDGLVVPMNAVNTPGAEPWVLRVVNGKTERVAGAARAARSADRAGGDSERRQRRRHPAPGRRAGDHPRYGRAGRHAGATAASQRAEGQQ